MTSFPPDSAGVAFDPALHQAFKNGTPRTTTAGRYFVKSRVNVTAAKARAAKAAPPPQAAPTPPPRPAVAPSAPVAPLAAAPREPVTHGPASVADLISDFPAPTITPGEPEPAPVAPDGPPPSASTVAEIPPDAAATLAAEAGNVGTAKFLTTMTEAAACITFAAPDEWAMTPMERAMIEAAMKDVLDESGAVCLTPKQRLALALGTYAAPRTTLPKTRAKLARAFDWLLGLVGRRKKEPAPASPATPAAAPHAPEVAPAALT